MKLYYDEEKIRRYYTEYGMEKVFGDIEPYIARLRIMEIRKGENPVRSDQKDWIYYLISGKLRVYAEQSDGKRLFLSLRDQNEILGDLEFIDVENITTVSIAAGPCVFLRLDARGIREQLLNNPKLLRKLLHTVATKLAHTSTVSAMLAMCSSETRICSYILCMASPGADGKTNIFREKLTETAEILGVSYRQLLRVIQNLCTGGVLVKSGAGYEIRDMAALEKMGGEIDYR